MSSLRQLPQKMGVLMLQRAGKHACIKGSQLGAFSMQGARRLLDYMLFSLELLLQRVGELMLQEVSRYALSNPVNCVPR